MTIEEAIDYLKNSMAIYEDDDSRHHNEVLEFTIKALEIQPYEKFESTKDHICKLAGDYKCWDNRLTHDEALELCHILEQEPCEDCVSRQAVLDNAYAYGNGLEPDGYCVNVEDIQALPSVTPKPKIERCKWIRYDYRTICPQNHDVDNPYWRIPERRMDVLKYCPYCGKEIEVTE